MPQPGDVDGVCFYGSTWAVTTAGVIVTLVIGIIGFAIGRLILRGRVREAIIRDSRASEQQLAALDRSFFSRSSIWLSLILVIAGVVLTYVGARGDVSFDFGSYGKLSTSVPGVAAAALGVIVWWVARPSGSRGAR